MSYSASAGRVSLRVWPAVLVGSAFAGLVVLTLHALEPSAKERQVCDALVRELMTTRDVVELQRAGILARSLRCDVARRAGPVLYRQLVAAPG